MPPKFYPKKKMTIKARLRQPNHANYLAYYHKGSTDDPFYATILKISTELAYVAKMDPHEIKNTSPEGFYFKNDKTMYLDINKRPCLAESICDRDVSIILTVQPYDFIADSTRKVGVSITALEVREVYEKH